MKQLGEPYGIALISEGEKDSYTLYSDSPAQLNKIKEILATVMVQTDFHSLYKSIRKIGKGNCATVTVSLFRCTWGRD